MSSKERIANIERLMDDLAESKAEIVRLLQTQRDLIRDYGQEAANQRGEIERLHTALCEVCRLAEQLPSGIDHEADPENESPSDMVAHIGGLICKAAEVAGGEQ